MTNVDFEDLVPQGQTPVEAADTPLSFDDLVPGSTPTTAPDGEPAQPAPSPGQQAPLSFDDLVPQEPQKQTPLERSLSLIPEPIRPVSRGIARAISGASVAAADAGIVSPETAVSGVQLGRDIEQALPRSEPTELALKEFQNLQGVGDTLAWMLRNKEAVATLFGESLGSSAAGIGIGVAGAGAGGVVGGPIGAGTGLVVGTGIGSGVTEYVISFEDALRERGYDVSDEKQLENALANPEFMAEVRKKATIRGASIGTVDALTSLFGVRGGGKAFVDFAATTIGRGVGKEIAGETAESIGRLTAEGLTNLAVETTGEGAGEAIAQFASTGQINVPDVVLEAALGAGPGAVDAVMSTALRAYGRGDVSQDVVDGAAPLGIDPFETQIQTIDEAQLSGRRFFGFAETGQQVVDVTLDPGQAERALGDGDARRGSLIAATDEEVTASADDFVLQSVAPDALFARVDFVGEGQEQARSLLAAAATSPDPEQAKALYRQSVELGARLPPSEGATSAIFVGDAQSARVLPQVRDLAANVKLTKATEGAFVAEPDPSLEQLDFRELERRLPGTFVPDTDGLEAVLDNPEFATARAELITFTDPVLEQDIATRGAKQVFAEQDPLDLVARGSIRVRPDSRFGDSFAILGDEGAVAQAIKDSTVSKQNLGNRFPSRGLFTDKRFSQPIDFDALTSENDVVVTVGQLEGVNSKTIKAGEALIKTLLERFNIKTRVLLVLGNTDVSDVANRNATATALGRHAVFANGHSIGVNVQDDVSFTTTLAHEFGHLLSYEKFVGLDIKTRGVIEAAYQRFIENVPTNNPQARGEQFLRRRFGLEARGNAQALLENRSRIAEKPDYFYSFEEWFAEQVSRWATTNRSTVGLLSSFFRKLAKQILFTLKQFRALVPGESFRPEPEMEAWLNAMLDGATTTNWHDGQRAVLDRVTLEQNRRVMGSDAVPMQHESIPVYQALDKFADQQDVNVPEVKAFTDKFNWLYKFFLNFRQVAERNQHIKELNVYRSLVEKAQVDANAIMAEAETLLREWRQLKEVKDGVPESVRLTRFMKELNAQTYLRPDEEQRGTRRWPTEAELRKLVQKHKLSNEGQQMYVRLRDSLLQSLQRIEEIAVIDAQKNISDPVLQQQAIAQARDLTRRAAAAPYFPMLRFGEFAVKVVNPNGTLEAFSMRETKRERTRLVKDLAKEFPASQGFKIIQTTVPQDAAHFANVPPWLLGKLKELPGLTSDQKEWIENFRAELAPSRSFLKRSLRQKGVRGEASDGPRTYATYMAQHARFFARVKYQAEMQDSINSLTTAARDAESAAAGVNDREARTNIAAYMQNHLRDLLNPSRDWAMLRSIAANWYLGFVPKAALVNTSQVLFGSYPFLASHFGDLRSLKEIGSSVKNLQTYYRDATIDQIDEPLAEAISIATEEGIITESMAAELAATANGGQQDVGFGKLQSSWLDFSRYAMLMFQMAEKWNRRVTFRAAWNLAMQQPDNAFIRGDRRRGLVGMKAKHFLEYEALRNRGLSERETLAYLTAKDVTISTQFDYSKAARPRFMRGRLGTLFTFYSFVQNTLFMLWNNPRAVPRYALVMMALAGPMGLVPEELEDILNFAGRKMLGRDFNLEKEARKFITQMFGENPPIPPDLALHGGGRYGMGIPAAMDAMGVSWFPQVDLSRSLALGRVIPLSPTGLLDPGADVNRLISDTTQSLAGAAFGIGFNGAKALLSSDLDFFDAKRWETALPTSAKNVARSFRQGFEGGERDRSYNPVFNLEVDDPTQFAELVAQSLGFTPTRVNQFWDRRMMAAEAQAFWAVKRQLLLRRAFKARVVDGDIDGFKNILGEIREHNKMAPDNKLKISNKTIQRSFRTRGRTREQVRQGRNPRIAPALQTEINRLFPEAVGVERVK